MFSDGIAGPKLKPVIEKIWKFISRRPPLSATLSAVILLPLDARWPAPHFASCGQSVGLKALFGLPDSSLARPDQTSEFYAANAELRHASSPASAPLPRGLRAAAVSLRRSPPPSLPAYCHTRLPQSRSFEATPSSPSRDHLLSPFLHSRQPPPADASSAVRLFLWRRPPQLPPIATPHPTPPRPPPPSALCVGAHLAKQLN